MSDLITAQPPESTDTATSPDTTTPKTFAQRFSLIETEVESEAHVILGRFHAVLLKTEDSLAIKDALLNMQHYVGNLSVIHQIKSMEESAKNEFKGLASLAGWNENPFITSAVDKDNGE